ncbi:hypothetical protein PFISCL1PPCAC_604, partial [Pristionchus fissidentatus]
IWRHGQRAPSHINDVSGREVFHNGAGALTDMGIKRSMELGKFLRKRYIVENQLLSRKMDETEINFQSTNVTRCMETLKLVARGMYGKDDDKKFIIPYKVNSQEDNLFGFAWFTCPALGKIFQSKC